MVFISVPYIPHYPRKTTYDYIGKRNLCGIVYNCIYVMMTIWDRRGWGYCFGLTMCHKSCFSSLFTREWESREKILNFELLGTIKPIHINV